MGWVVMGSRPCVFIRDSYEKGKRHVRDIKTYQVRGHSHDFSPDGGLVGPW